MMTPLGMLSGPVSTFIGLAGTLACTVAWSASQLPPGSQIGIRKIVANSRAESLKLTDGDIRAKLLGDDQVFRILFFSVPAPEEGCPTCQTSHINVYTTSGERFWSYDVGLHGPISTVFYTPTGTHELFKGKPPAIVSFAVIGASAGGILNIFQWNGKTFEDIAGPWHSIDQVDRPEFKDLDGDGVMEVIIHHSTINSVSSFGPQSIYKWNGEKYERQEGGSTDK